MFSKNSGVGLGDWWTVGMLSTCGESGRRRCLAVDQLNAVWAFVLVPAKTL